MGRRQFIAGALAASTSTLFYDKIAMASGQASSIDKNELQKGKMTKRHKVVSFGNETMNLGHAIAADLSLLGLDVTLLERPENAHKFETIKKQGGFNVTGDIKALTSQKTGFAKITNCTTDPKEALDGADLIFVNAPVDEFEKWITHIVPYIEDGAILHFNYYGYWSSLRIYPILKKAGKENVTITECPSSLYYSGGQNGNIDFTLMKQGIPLSVFPTNRSDSVFKTLHDLYPTFVPAKNVIETNFMNLNMIWHAPIALLNIAHFDRLKASGEDKANFYGTGITESTSLLTEAQDKEREAVCEAYNIPYRPLMGLANQFSEGFGETIYEAQRDAKFVKQSSPYPIDLWKQWLGWDLPLAMVPLISLAELAGVEMPIYKGLTHIFGGILGTDYWKEGLTLEKLGLENKSFEDVLKYVNDGIGEG